MLKILATLPASLTGLAFGIAGFTGALETVFAPSIAAIGCVITAILVFSIRLHNIVHFSIFIQEFKHPVSDSYIPTLFMASMLCRIYSSVCTLFWSDSLARCNSWASCNMC